MDLNQTKLSKTEWNNTEVPVDTFEKFILTVVKDGFDNINICENMNKSLFQIIKIDITKENEEYLFFKYFDNFIREVLRKYHLEINYTFKSNTKNKKVKKVDMMRIENMDSVINNKKGEIFEYELLSLSKNIIKSLYNENNDFIGSLYTLIHIKNVKIQHVNTFVMEFVEKVITYAKERLSIRTVISMANNIIEKNSKITKYQNIELYDHQKKLYSIFQNYTPKLVLYIAPTGTGKTMSPLGLSQKFKIIFICVSRHIGLALAKSAISMEKKIAFAFGCQTASDIRLHYFAASEYSINNKTGGIWKVDNSVGNKVEIMICDVQSYLVAMHYMLAFNSETEIVTYWDEPTITMDYENHDLHEVIHNNWKNNKISKMVLSCATLPKEHEIRDSIMDFKMKFEDSELFTIESHDFKKSISLLDKDTKCVLPHLLHSDYNDLLECVNFCSENKTLLRYLDLDEVVKCIEYLNDFNLIEEEFKINNYFETIEDVTMKSIKEYYLLILRRFTPVAKWSEVHNLMKINLKYKYTLNDTSIKRMSSFQEPHNGSINVFTKKNSLDNLSDVEHQHRGLLLTTRDAFTLTSGPTIYMVDDVNKIGKFYIKSSNIPKSIIDNITQKLMINGSLGDKIDKLQEKLENIKGEKEEPKENTKGTGKDKSKSRKDARQEENSPELRKLMNDIENLKMQLQEVNLDVNYLPNSKQHQKIWTNQYDENSYCPTIDDSIVARIMEIPIENYLKVLLLLGIGTFDNNIDQRYLEIMKEMAYNQHLYLIIASTDYIYGTNYSFCHGYIGKDLSKMTQQKIIQAMGRIGRNKLQNDYSVRFRNDELIKKIFSPRGENMEAINMNKLFSSE